MVEEKSFPRQREVFHPGWQFRLGGNSKAGNAKGGDSVRLAEPVGSADGCVDSDCAGREQADSGDDGKVHVAQDGTLDSGTAEDGCVHALA